MKTKTELKKAEENYSQRKEELDKSMKEFGYHPVHPDENRNWNKIKFAEMEVESTTESLAIVEKQFMKLLGLIAKKVPSYIG